MDTIYPSPYRLGMASTISLDELLASRFLYVPDYQRGYAWGPDQLEEFWEDLELLEPGRPHYAGTVVLQSRPEPVFDEDRQASLEPHYVVDGQQRITTCFMLLDRLFDHLDLLNHQDTPAQRRRLLTANVGGVVQPKLHLASDLHEHWSRVILEGVQPVQGPRMAAERRLSVASEFFEGRIHEGLARWDGSTGSSWLLTLTGKVINGLRFTLYQVEDGSDVGVIFETVNQRGKSLTELEKTKNYLLYLASLLDSKEQRAELTQHVNRCWRDIFGSLADLNSRHEDQLLRAHWLATRNPRDKEWNDAKSVKAEFHRRKYVKDKQLLRQDVKTYSQSLRDASFAYRDLVDENANAFSGYGLHAGRLAAAARELRQAGVVLVFAPLLIAARLVAPTKGDDYLELLRACETYSVRVFLIGERRSNAGKSRLYTLAKDMFDSGGDFTAALAGILERIAYFASDESTLSELRNTRRNWYAKQGHKFFLYQYEISLLKGVAPAIRFDELVRSENRARTTEHILPQSPKDPCWDVFSDEDRERLTHCLGNLVLTYDNSVYSNYCFARKRDGVADALAAGSRTPCYSTSTLKQEQLLKDLEAWTPDAVIERQERIASWAMTRWGIPAATVPLLDETDLDDVASEDPDPLLVEDATEA